MRIRASLVALMVSLGCGCGASVRALVAHGQVREACLALRSPRSDEQTVASAFNEQTQGTMHVNALTPDELAELLPFVPEPMQRGDVLLVGLRVSVDRLVADRLLPILQTLGTDVEWRPFHLRDDASWARLNGRAPRERSGGLLAGLGRLAHITGAVAAQSFRGLVWAGSLGQTDLATHPGFPRLPSGPPASQREAEERSAAILHGLTESEQCALGADESCTTYHLMRRTERPWEFEPKLVVTFVHVIGSRPDGGAGNDGTYCSVGDSRYLDLPNEGSAAERINAAFAGGPLPITR